MAGIILGGTAGDNVLNGTTSGDSIYGNGGFDILNGLEGDDTVASGSVYDAATGTTLPDTVGDQLDGGPGNDRLLGGNGHDRLFAGPGNDTMDGGAGMDTAYLQVNSTSATITRDGNVVTIQSSLGTDTLQNVERVVFNDSAMAWDIEGNAGQIYRLYQAAFNRTPDAEGLGFWIHAIDHGTALSRISFEFGTSPEFAQRYGANASNDAYITALYANTLHRAPDAQGYAFWMDALERGIATREQLLIDFSESPENKAQVIGSIQNGFSYDPWENTALDCIPSKED
ncbi:MAG: hypothetical protein K0R43_2936 [Pseudoduganella sp.]|nr:hypothetical protein [Pseudoduganella sp.]